MTNNPKFRLLAIDGGGVCGIIPARILTEIEQRTSKQIHQLFDLSVGTSTGGLLISGLMVPGQGAAKYSANDMLELYMSKSATIFQANFFHKLTTGFGLWNAKYDRKYLDEILNQYLGQYKMQECMKPTIITSYDVTSGNPRFFSSQNKSEDFLLSEIVGGATAAPTYFAPKQLSSGDYLADAAIYADNPEMIAATEMMNMNPHLQEEEVMILSIGTGRVALAKSASQLQDAGMIGWVLEAQLINIMMSASGELFNNETKAIYPNTTRLQLELPQGSGLIDDASEQNLENLLKATEDYIVKNSQLIDEICTNVVK